MDRELVGVAKEGPVGKWLEKKRQWDQRFASTKKKVHKQFVKDLAIGYEGFGEGEFPPPSALAGRRKKEGVTKMKKRKKSMGLAMWALWVSHSPGGIRIPHQMSCKAVHILIFFC